MKKFDLQKAIDGYPLQTAMGCEVKDFSYHPSADKLDSLGNESYCCSAVADGILRNFTRDGKFINNDKSDKADPLDLFLKTEHHTRCLLVEKTETAISTDFLHIKSIGFETISDAEEYKEKFHKEEDFFIIRVSWETP